MRNALPAIFAGNATYGAGGQGEFLRQMTVALDGYGGAIYARDPGPAADGIVIPRAAGAAGALNVLQRIPLLRARHDLLTLVDDVDFDAGVARRMQPARLFDGVIGQCRLGAARARVRGARIVLTSLNTHIEDLAGVLAREYARLGIAARPFVHPMMRRRAADEIAQADWIRVNSRRAAASFIARGADPSRVEVIRPAVDLAHFVPQPVVAGGPFRVLSVASIDPRKGPHHLLDAFVSARIPDSTLEMIGGTGTRWAKTLMETHLRQHGNITMRHGDVMALPASDTYGRASVLVHAALEDGFGLVVAQALACARPVIVTDATGAAELIEDGVNGFVVPAGSPVAIREKLQLLASDRTLLAAMSHRAPAAVAARGYADFARDVRAFYDKAVA